MPRFTVYVERCAGWIEARTYGEAYREAVKRFERDGQRIARVEVEVFGRGAALRSLDDAHEDSERERAARMRQKGDPEC